MNTAPCRSAISYIDGDKGILRYRGYPIEELAESSTFLEARAQPRRQQARSARDDWRRRARTRGRRWRTCSCTGACRARSS